MSEIVVDIEVKRFPAMASMQHVTALKGLRFSVALGEFVCVLGPSGCGKTTLLNIVAGLDRDYKGQVIMPGSSTAPDPVLGYVFQSPRLLPWRTVEENIHLVLRSGQDAGIVDELLSITGLSEFRNMYPERLSAGMSRRAALARAFAVQPDLLLMDEPFVSLDESTAQRLRKLLLEIWSRRPTTVLFVTHDTREAIMLADRIIRLTPSPGSVSTMFDVGIPRQQRSDAELIEAWRNQHF